MWSLVFLKVFWGFLRVVHVSCISLTLHSPSRLWMPFLFKNPNHCLRTTNRRRFKVWELPWSPSCVLATIMHSTHEEGGRAWLLFFLRPKHTVLFWFFPKDLQKSKSERETERWRGREKDIFQALLLWSPSSTFSILSPHNSHDTMKSCPRNISRWEAGFSPQYKPYSLTVRQWNLPSF